MPEVRHQYPRQEAFQQAAIFEDPLEQNVHNQWRDLLEANLRLTSAVEAGQWGEVLQQMRGLVHTPNQLSDNMLRKIAEGTLTVGEIVSPRRMGFFSRPERVTFFWNERATQEEQPTATYTAFTVKGSSTMLDATIDRTTKQAIEWPEPESKPQKLSRDQTMRMVSPEQAKGILEDRRNERLQREIQERQDAFKRDWPSIETAVRISWGATDNTIINNKTRENVTQSLTDTRQQLERLSVRKVVSQEEIFSRLEQVGLVERHRTVKVSPGSISGITFVTANRSLAYVYGKDGDVESRIAMQQDGKPFIDRAKDAIVGWMADHRWIPNRNDYTAARVLHSLDPTALSHAFPPGKFRAIHEYIISGSTSARTYQQRNGQRTNSNYSNTRSTRHETDEMAAFNKALDVLGLPPNTIPSQEQVKKAYRKRAKEQHPDVSGRTAEMTEINLAHDLVNQMLERHDSQ